MVLHDSTKLLEIGRRFAAALDACDYAEAEHYLATNCRYHGPNGITALGPAQILQTYRDCDAKARRAFDTVVYRSEAALDESGAIRLTFFDELHRAGTSHTYCCGQIVYFDELALISRIELLEYPSARERLKQFCAAAGITID